ncbi:kinase-regulated stress-responsive transcription factor skn7 [Mortierella sp. GBA43]|nr:kinase-regulated stress-responsive transcription factor skn7 [Mortierella sp. GBA43]
MPRYFGHNNFASLVRRFNRYDFHKIKTTNSDQVPSYGDQAWEFQHPKFQYGKISLVEEIRVLYKPPRAAQVILHPQGMYLPDAPLSHSLAEDT